MGGAQEGSELPSESWADVARRKTGGVAANDQVLGGAAESQS